MTEALRWLSSLPTWAQSAIIGGALFTIIVAGILLVHLGSDPDDRRYLGKRRRPRKPDSRHRDPRTGAFLLPPYGEHAREVREGVTGTFSRSIVVYRPGQAVARARVVPQERRHG